jgi:hypothetical protein
MDYLHQKSHDGSVCMCAYPGNAGILRCTLIMFVCSTSAEGLGIRDEGRGRAALGKNLPGRMQIRLVWVLCHIVTVEANISSQAFRTQLAPEQLIILKFQPEPHPSYKLPYEH